MNSGKNWQSKLRVYASNEPRIGIVRTAMGACAQIAVFTYAVMRRTPRYEIRLAAPFADNLMNSVAHCGELPINVERLLRHIYELGARLQLPSMATSACRERPVRSTLSFNTFRENVTTSRQTSSEGHSVRRGRSAF